jgi:hypothetical protein
MNIIKITCDIARYSENYDRFPDGTFDIDILTGNFDTEVTDLFNLVKKPYTPSKGDKIYFLPGVNIPRVKFKNVCVEHGIKTIRDIEQATVIFGSKKSLCDITTSHWSYKCKTSDFKDFIKLYEADIDNHSLEKIENAFEYYDQEFIAIDYNLKDWIANKVSGGNSFPYSQRLSMIKDEYADLFNSLLNKEILDESCVMNVLNGEDATEIDKEMFEHLSEMFESSDNDNHVLAMEIMANCKYVESLIYLEMLFYKYAGRISDKHTKNHVNFKSLLGYLEKDKSYLGTDIDDIAKSLENKDQFTTDKLEIIMEYLSKDIQNTGDSKYFTVKTITVHPDYIANLGSNYTYEVQKDYVPILVEKPITEEEIEEIPIQIEAVIEEQESEFTVEDSLEEEVVTNLDNICDEPESNNNQIKTNDTNDFDWF